MGVLNEKRFNKITIGNSIYCIETSFLFWDSWEDSMLGITIGYRSRLSRIMGLGAEGASIIL